VRLCLPQAQKYICCETGFDPCTRAGYYYDDLHDCCPTGWTCNYPYPKLGNTVWYALPLLWAVKPCFSVCVRNGVDEHR